VVDLAVAGVVLGKSGPVWWGWPLPNFNVYLCHLDFAFSEMFYEKLFNVTINQFDNERMFIIEMDLFRQ
jgi:hypothetical protein